MKILDDCGSNYFELFGDDNFDKKAIYNFVFLGTYIGDKYGDSSDEWVCTSEYKQSVSTTTSDAPTSPKGEPKNICGTLAQLSRGLDTSSIQT